MFAATPLEPSMSTSQTHLLARWIRVIFPDHARTHPRPTARARACARLAPRLGWILGSALALLPVRGTAMSSTLPAGVEASAAATVSTDRNTSELPASGEGSVSPEEKNRASRVQTVLFIGNSFTFGYGSPVQFFHPERVTDLNGQGVGGVPALFKTFSLEAGLNHAVSLETAPGKNLDWHLARKRGLLARAWDHVIAQGYSTLDRADPGNPAVLIASARELAELLTSKNPQVRLWLTATWSRADLAYRRKGYWYRPPIDRMARDLMRAYERAAAQPGIHAVIPVGLAWNRAMDAGVADANPYDGIGAGAVDLWTWDHYHASTYGYYLEALMVFGKVTGLDPRSLGKNERAAFELGISPAQAAALQQVAHDELSAPRPSRPEPGTD